MKICHGISKWITPTLKKNCVCWREKGTLKYGPSRSNSKSFKCCWKLYFRTKLLPIERDFLWKHKVLKWGRFRLCSTNTVIWVEKGSTSFDLLISPTWQMSPLVCAENNLRIWRTKFYTKLINKMRGFFSHGWWRWRWPLTYQNRWRGWPLPGSWPCQSALCPDRNAGISAAPASLCRWCGRHSVEENAHKQTNTTTDKLMTCKGFDSLSQHKPNKLTRHFESAGPLVREVWKTVCSAPTKTWIIIKHPALHFHAARCCFAGLQMAIWKHSIHPFPRWSLGNDGEHAVWCVR